MRLSRQYTTESRCISPRVISFTMLAQFAATFGMLFPTRTSRLWVSAFVMVAVMLPVSEMIVLGVFSSLVVDGPAEFRESTTAGYAKVGLLLAAFAATRCIDHAVRLGRVRVFRTGFEESGRKRSPNQESWEWALAFELSGVLASLVQVAMFGGLFFLLDLPTAAVNLSILIVVVSLLSAIYARQLGLQRAYVEMGSGPGTVAISQRVGWRIRDAEIGAMLASAAVIVVLICLLVRILAGDIGSANAIMLFLGLRLLAGQLGALSASTMRFARALARRGDV